MGGKPDGELEEQLLRKAASLYLNEQGDGLLAEALRINGQPFEGVDRVSEKIRAKRRSAWMKKITAVAIPAAACLILAVSHRSMQSMPQTQSGAPAGGHGQNAPMPGNDAMPGNEHMPGSAQLTAEPLLASETAAAEFLSARLPQGFTLEGAGLDNGCMVCRIGGPGGEIVLVMEEWGSIGTARPMARIEAGGAEMYALRMNDYSLLTYKRGDLRFTLTTPYNYKDLILIGGLLA